MVHLPLLTIHPVFVGTKEQQSPHALKVTSYTK